MIARSPRIAVIGCGAATERLHLPALERLKIRPALLVDANLSRATELAKRFHADAAAASLENRLSGIEAAIVALPHHLHAPVSIDLLQRGIHVLVEKPMALSPLECERVLDAAADSGAVLAVGLMRRFLTRLNWVKAAIDANALGAVHSFDIQEGTVYRWPVSSGFFFKRETAGGGVLADTGAHTLDLVLWWFGEPASLEYFDDNHGGVEANCLVRLWWSSGLVGTIDLSRTRDLRNTAVIRGERGEVTVRLDDSSLDTLTASPDSILHVSAGGSSGKRLPEQRFRELFPLQLQDWLDAIATGCPPRVGGAEAARSVALIERCYAQRRALELPWESVVERAVARAV